MNLPLVSVVIPTFNSAWSLKEAIESVLAQTYEQLEILVIDDGSTDNTAEVVAEFSDIITYMRQNNMGVSVARNCGILSSHGKYIAFLDSDDIWFPNKIELQVALMEEHSNLDVVYTDHCHTDAEGVIGEPKTACFNASEPVYYQLLAGNFINTSTVMVRLTAIAKSGVFSADFSGAEDYDLWLRLAKSGEFGHVCTVLATYRKHQFNTTKTTSYSRQEANFCNRLWRNSQHDPKACALLKPKMARVFRKLGNREWQDGRYTHARQAIQKSMKYGDYRWKSVVQILASFSPPVLIRKIESLFATQRTPTE